MPQDNRSTPFLKTDDAQPTEVLRLRRRALWLVGATAAYNVIEGIVAVWSGAVSGSVALVAFGLDSGIECVAAGVLLWRLADASDSRERVARKVVGATFLLLASYVLLQSTRVLLGDEAPGESLIGIILGVLSLLVMPAVSWAKLRVASRLGSRALRAEALETLACAYLTVTLLGGLALNAAFAWWWADPVAAALMVPWLVREGLEGLTENGDGC